MIDVALEWVWPSRRAVLGVHASGLEQSPGQMSLLDEGRSERWGKAMKAADLLRDKFGESAVSLASSMKGRFREAVHEADPEVRQPAKKRPDQG